MKLTNLKKRLGMAASVMKNGEVPAGTRQEIPPITSEEITEIKEFFPMSKFFIFGHARSGTTLLVRLVRLHTDVHCNYQAHFFTRKPLLQSLVSSAEVGEWLTRRSNRWNGGRDLSPAVLRAASDFILEREARRLGKHIVGDKSPNTLLEDEAVRLMHKVYPDARLIFIVRDGRDVAISHRFQNFIDAPQHLPAEDLRIREDFARRPEPYLAGERSVFTSKALEREAGGWSRNVTRTHQAAGELYSDRYLHLRYEDLLAEPLEVMKMVWSFLGADSEAEGLEAALQDELKRNPDADWQSQKAGDLVEPLEKGKQGSWRALFTAQDRQAFKQLAGQALIDWGYEHGFDW